MFECGRESKTGQSDWIKGRDRVDEIMSGRDGQKLKRKKRAFGMNREDPRACFQKYTQYTLIVDAGQALATSSRWP